MSTVNTVATTTSTPTTTITTTKFSTIWRTATTTSTTSLRKTVTATDFVLPTGSTFNIVDSDGLSVTWPVTDASGNPDFLGFNTDDPTAFYLDYPSNSLIIAETDQTTSVLVSDGSCSNGQCSSSAPVTAAERAASSNDIVPTCSINQATSGGVCSIKCTRPDKPTWNANWKDDSGIWYLANPASISGGTFDTFVNMNTPGSDSQAAPVSGCGPDCTTFPNGSCAC